MIIVYESNTGFTEQYAQMLSEETGLACFPRRQAGKGEEAVYLGWLCARKVQGLKKAMGRCRVRAVVAVGMSQPSEKLLQEIAVGNALGEDTPLFYARGGLAPDKLKGMYKMMMKTAIKMAVQGAAPEAERTPEEADMLDMMERGGSRVDRANLDAVLAWYRARTDR